MVDTQMSEERFNALAPRIKEKVLAARAAAERREAKIENREALRDWLRHEELRSIPIKDRTQEEKNETQRLRRRLDKYKEESKVAINERVTLDEFWKLNRASVTSKIPAWREQEERVLDQIFWMNKGWACSPLDPNFVSLQEGLEDLDEFVAEFGLIPDIPSACQDPDLRDFQPPWALLENIHKDPERLNALCRESPAAEIYVRYGIRTALFAYEVQMFKQRIAEHERAKVHSDVRRAHLEYERDRCWLCKQFDFLQKQESNGTTE